MPRERSDQQLVQEFSEQIKALLRSESIKSVAQKLGVTTQTIYNYRNAKTGPSAEVIRHAMEAWGVRLTYRGRTLLLTDFSRIKPTQATKAAKQYELWEAIKKLDPSSIKVEILDRESGSVRLGVRIAFKC